MLQVLEISRQTTDQAGSDTWFEYRAGGMTENKLNMCSKKVDLKAGEIKGKTTSLLKDIMQYRPPFYSPLYIGGGTMNSLHVNSLCGEIADITSAL